MLRSRAAAPTNCAAAPVTPRPARPSRVPCGWVPAPHDSLHQHPRRPPARDVAARAGFGSVLKGRVAKSSKDCPCDSGLPYSRCCEPFHKSSGLAPPSPEALVRARFSAFVKKQPKFLKATSHPDNPALKGSVTGADVEVQRKCSYEEDLAVTFLSVEFTRLTILGASVAPDGRRASVDAEARFRRRVDEAGKRVKAPAEQLWRERAQLVKDEDGRWLVLDVQQLAQEQEQQQQPAAEAEAAAPA